MRALIGVAAIVLAITPTPASANQFIAYFDYGDATMSEGGYATARRVVAYIRNSSDAPKRILIVAHMDAAEIDEFSEELALRRAQAMATELVQSGIDPAVLETQSRGATQMARPTEDHVREALNRRLTVDVNF